MINEYKKCPPFQVSILIAELMVVFLIESLTPKSFTSDLAELIPGVHST